MKFNIHQQMVSKYKNYYVDLSNSIDDLICAWESEVKIVQLHQRKKLTPQ